MPVSYDDDNNLLVNTLLTCCCCLVFIHLIWLLFQFHEMQFANFVT